MLHKCANPDCSKKYKYFSEGVLFEFKVDEAKNYQPVGSGVATRKREIFWLCNDCARTMTLDCRAGSVTVIEEPSRKIA